MCNGTISATASANHYFSLDTFNLTPPHTGVRIVSVCNAPFTPIKERILEYHELLQNEWKSRYLVKGIENWWMNLEGFL